MSQHSLQTSHGGLPKKKPQLSLAPKTLLAIQFPPGNYFRKMQNDVNMPVTIEHDSHGSSGTTIWFRLIPLPNTLLPNVLRWSFRRTLSESASGSLPLKSSTALTWVVKLPPSAAAGAGGGRGGTCLVSPLPLPELQLIFLAVLWSAFAHSLAHRRKSPAEYKPPKEVQIPTHPQHKTSCSP